MNRNKFSKVTLEQYLIDTKRELPIEVLTEEYENIRIPCRGTKYSAGYDFFSPFDFELRTGETILIPTGIRVELEKDKFLQMAPRSGLGFKYRLQMDNTIPIIDSDYVMSDNQGHIMLKLTNDSKNKNNDLSIRAGQGIAQGIILQYFLTEDDDQDYKPERNGGLGSTTKTA